MKLWTELKRVVIRITSPAHGFTEGERVRVQFLAGLFLVGALYGFIMFIIGTIFRFEWFTLQRSLIQLIVCPPMFFVVTRTPYYKNAIRIVIILYSLFITRRSVMLLESGNAIAFLSSFSTMVVGCQLVASFVLNFKDLLYIIGLCCIMVGSIPFLARDVSMTLFQEVFVTQLLLNIVFIALTSVQRLLDGRLQRQSVELTQARDSAVEASKLKSNFVAMMSHELRTPLNGIIGLTEMLLRSDLQKDQRDWVENVQTSGRVLLSLADQVLDFSRIEAGKFDLHEEEFSVRELVEDCVQVCGVSAQKHVDVVGIVDPAVPAVMGGDRIRLQQVIVNLLGNASKFTPKGQIILSVTPHETTPDGFQRIDFVVADSGIGMSPERKSLLFEAFSQGDNRKYGGAGLGLVISRRITNLMRGDITVESEEGKGSQFTASVCLRLVRESSPFAPRPLHGLEYKIACVNPVLAEIYQQIIESWGASVPTILPTTHLEDLSTHLERSDTRADGIIIDAEDPVPIASALQSRFGIPAVALVARHDQAQYRLSTTRLQVVRKPVKQAQLLDALAVLSNSESITPKSDMSVEKSPALPQIFARILMAEDYPVNQMVMKLMLDKLGCTVDIANDGQQAYDRLRASEPGYYQAVLMDLQMPNMDGFEATTAIRTLERQTGRSPIPIIAVTASAMAEEQQRCIDGGMDDAISKPVNILHLSTKLQRWAAMPQHI